MSSHKVVPFIICGGGVGLPLLRASRESFSKQIIALLSWETIPEGMPARVKGDSFAKPLILTHSYTRFLVASPMMQVSREGDVLLELSRHSSCRAIAAAVAFVAKQEPTATLLVLASDDVILKEVGFEHTVGAAAPAASEGRVVTFGNANNKPATGYGCNNPSEPANAVTPVAQFAKKSDSQTATHYIPDGNLWNSGVFMSRADSFLGELTKCEPEMVAAANAAYAEATDDIGLHRVGEAALSWAPKQSIDYAVMERSTLALIMPASFSWSDVGNWKNVWSASKTDAAGNGAGDKVKLLDSRNCDIQAANQLTVMVGIEDAIVIVEDGAAIAADWNRAADVNKAFENRKAGNDANVISSRWVYVPGLLPEAELQRLLADQAHPGRHRPQVLPSKASLSGRALGSRVPHRLGNPRKGNDDALRKRADLSPMWLRPLLNQPRQDTARDRQSSIPDLSWRGRHRLLRGRV